MARRVVSLDLKQPWHEYRGPGGEARKASPTVDSLVKKRVVKKEKKLRVVIRHKREI